MTSTKSRTKTALAIGLLGILTTLKPATCRGQAEVDPDHYETPINGSASAGIRVTTRPSSATSKLSRERFRGEFFLPFNIDYAGVNLPPGSYSVSVRSMQDRNSVTLIPDGSAVRIQAIRVPHLISSGKGPSALVLQRKGEQRTLIAIRLEKPRVTLTFHSEETRSDNVSTELVPISSTDRKFEPALPFKPE